MTSEISRDNLKELFLYGEERAKQIIASYEEYLDRIQNGDLYLSVIDNGEYWSAIQLLVEMTILLFLILNTWLISLKEYSKLLKEGQFLI